MASLSSSSFSCMPWSWSATGELNLFFSLCLSLSLCVFLYLCLSLSLSLPFPLSLSLSLSLVPLFYGTMLMPLESACSCFSLPPFLPQQFPHQCVLLQRQCGRLLGSSALFYGLLCPNSSYSNRAVGASCHPWNICECSCDLLTAQHLISRGNILK